MKDEIRGLDNWKFSIIDTLNDGNNDGIGEELSWKSLVICVWLYLLFCELVKIFVKVWNY